MLEKLFERFIIATPSDQTGIIFKPLKPIDQLKDKYFMEVNNHFIQDKTISYTDIQDLIAPVKVDLVGRNEKDVFVE